MAAALGVNTSLQTLELTGWTWDELGNGTASPFIMLGPASGLSTVKIDTKLFDVESAGVLLDLLQRGLIELKRPSGQGALQLCGGFQSMDEWFGEMTRQAHILRLHAGVAHSSGSEAYTLFPAAQQKGGGALGTTSVASTMSTMTVTSRGTPASPR